MSQLFRHSSLILVAVVLVNALIARARIPRFVSATQADPGEAERFVWVSAGWLIGLFAIMEVLVVATGASSPLCFTPRGLPSTQWQWVAWSVAIVWVAGLSAWVWFGAGADWLARFGPLFAKRFDAGRQYSASTIRVVVLLWCVAVIAVPLFIPASGGSTLSCP